MGRYGYGRDDKAHLLTATIFCGVATLAVAVGLIIYGYHLSRDIDAVIDRAQVAADREDMVEYLTELKKNMEEYGMTSGHFAVFFTTPANDLALHYKTVKRVLERLESIKNISKSETSYQVALDDIRGIIRELENPAMGFLWASYWWLILLTVGIWIWPAVVAHRS